MHHLPLSYWYAGSGVVLDYIDSCSLHSYLLCARIEKMTVFKLINRVLLDFSLTVKAVTDIHI